MGGLGLDEVDLVLVLEETGYAALPEPVVEHAAVAVPMLDAPLTAVSSDEIVTAPFHHDDVVPYADRADWFLMFRDDAFHLVARADVRLERRESVDGARRLALVEWEVARAERVAEGDAAGLAFDRGALGTAAQLVGLTRRMVDMTVEYVKERQQFGAPIGSFQAVKHHLADARIGLEFARPLVYRAAWSVAHGDADRVRRRDARGPQGAPVPRRDGVLVRVRPAPLHEARLGPRRRVGRRALAPGPRRSGDPVSIVAGEHRNEGIDLGAVVVAGARRRPAAG